MSESQEEQVVLAEKDGVIIRYATEKDLPRLRRFGVNFYQQSSLLELGIFYNQQSLDSFFRFLVAGRESSTGIALVAQKEGFLIGVIGGVVAPCYTDMNQTHVKENFLWVKKEVRNTPAWRSEERRVGKECRSRCARVH